MKSKRAFRTTPLSVAFSDIDTTKTVPLNFWGYLEELKITTPDWADDPTLTVAIKDVAGYTIFSQATLAEATQHSLTINRHIPSGCNLVLTLSVAPGGTGGNIEAVAYGASATM